MKTDLKETFLKALMDSIQEGTFELSDLLPDAKQNMHCTGRDAEGCNPKCAHRTKHAEIVAVVGTVEKPEVINFCSKCFCYQTKQPIHCLPEEPIPCSG